MTPGMTESKRPRIQTPREHSSALAGSTCTQSADSRTGYRSAFHPRDAAPQRKRTSGGSSPHRCDEPPKHGVEFLIYANCVRAGYACYRYRKPQFCELCKILLLAHAS